MARATQYRNVCSTVLVFVFCMIQWRLSAAAGECPCTSVANPCCSSTGGHCGSSPLYCDNCDVSRSFTSTGECPLATTNGTGDPSDCKDDPKSCPSGTCCSRAQKCGDTKDHCGAGCLGGACYSNMTTGAKIGIGVACGVAAVLLGLLIFYLRHRYKAKQNQPDGAITKFSYHKLVLATGNFQNPIGKGGYGKVYKGTLENTKDIAVKHLVFSSEEDTTSPQPRSEKRTFRSVGMKSLAILSLGLYKYSPPKTPIETQLKSFEAEIKTLAGKNNKYLVALLGYCFNEKKGERYLVYEYVNNKTLADSLFLSEVEGIQKQVPISWENRKRIAEGVATVLEYLHGGLHGLESIIHLDIKPDNILLDANLTPKVSDFGCAQVRAGDTYTAEARAGTNWYRAPEIQSSSGKAKASPKADVFSYGIVLLELVCGLRVYREVGGSAQYLPLLVLKAAEKVQDGELDFLDPELQLVDVTKMEAKRFIRVALWCLQQDFKRRPAMSDVKKLLEMGYHDPHDHYPVDTELPQGLRADLSDFYTRSTSPQYTSMSSRYGAQDLDLESAQDLDADHSNEWPLFARHQQSSSDPEGRVR